jgi:hypothetical protein
MDAKSKKTPVSRFEIWGFWIYSMAASDWGLVVFNIFLNS